MAYIDTSKITIPKGFFDDLNIPKLLDWLNSQPTADVVEVKDCNLCVFNSRHATEYPCSHCKNCYTDKFKPIE